MVIYFSATGNSKFVAEAIADRLGDETVNANTYIKEGKKGSFTSEKPYVFVFPVYLSTSPTILREFIKSSKFSGNRDAYFVPTCASAAGSVPNAMSDLCHEMGSLNFKGSCKVRMPQNYIILFRMFTKEQQEACYKNAAATIDRICEKITRGENLDDKAASGFEYWITKLVEKWYNASFTKTKGFHATDACSGCGACAKLCPTNSIEIKDGKPVWTKRICIHCMACINRCPNQAIEYGKKTVGKPRYVCPSYKSYKNN